jgi:hypothetical protein
MTFSKYALEANKPVTGMFETAPYASEGVAITEASLYKSEGHVTQPLVKTGKSLLVIGYPIERQVELEEPLRQASLHLDEGMLRVGSALRQQLRAIETISKGKTENLFSVAARNVSTKIPIIPGVAEIDAKQFGIDLRRRFTAPNKKK